MARPRKSKIVDSIRKHDDVHVRLMADCLETAMRHGMKGDLARMMANLRNASDFERQIPTDVKLDIYANMEVRSNG